MANPTSLIIQVDGQVREIDIESTDHPVKIMHQEIGCPVVRPLELEQGIIFWLDDMGSFTQLPNRGASGIAAMHGYLSPNPIMGPVIVTGRATEEGIFNLPADQAKTISGMAGSFARFGR